MRVFNRSIVEMLGEERLPNVKVIGDNEVEQSMYGQLVLGKGVSSSLEEQLVKEVKKAGIELGEQFASTLDLRSCLVNALKNLILLNFFL